MIQYDEGQYYIDFSDRDNLTSEDKEALENIQTYRPMERVDFLSDYLLSGKITDDDYEKMTGIPFNY